MINSIPIERFSQNAINPMVMGIQNFKRFLQQLINAGVNSNVVLELKNHVHRELVKGNDPQFQSSSNGLYVDNKFFVLFPGLKGESSNPKKTNIDGLVDQLARSSGDKTLILISQLVDVDKVIGEFSAIFANGFDVTCWGASYNKSKAAKDIQVDFPHMLKVSGLENGVTKESINKFSILIDSYIGDAQNGTNRKFAKCTQKGHKFRLDESIKFRQTIFDAFRKDPSIIITEIGSTIGQGSLQYPGYASGKQFNLNVYPAAVYDVQISRSTNKSISTSGFGGLALASLALFAFVKLSSGEPSREKETLKTT